MQWRDGCVKSRERAGWKHLESWGTEIATMLSTMGEKKHYKVRWKTLQMPTALSLRHLDGNQPNSLQSLFFSSGRIRAEF